MSSPLRPRGISRAGTVWGRTSARASGAATTSWGSSSSVPFAVARAITARTSSTRSRSTRLSPTSPPSAAIKRERHRAPDQQRVDALDERGQHAELVRDLRSTEDGDVRSVGIGQQAAEHLDLSLEQPSRHRLPTGRSHEFGQGRDARVRAMGRPERVVHVGVGELGELPGEPDVVGLLPRMEPEVLEEHDVAGLDVAADRLGPVADDLVEGHHVDAEQLRQAVGDGPEAELVLRLALRPPEMRGDHERGAPVEELAERGDGRADPHVVGDPAALERHVEVGADEDPGAGDVAEIVEGAERH